MEQKNVLHGEAHTDPILDRKITPWFLIKFAIPTMISMLVFGISGLIDGIFASRFIDAYALSAVGLVSPFIMFVLSIGFMFGIGGNAYIGKEIGAGNFAGARKSMTLVTIAALSGTSILALIGWIFPDLVLRILGVDADVHAIALGYMIPLLPFLPLGGMGMVLQQFMITEGKAHYSMIAALMQGIASAVLNYVFVYMWHMGIQGAALATGIAWFVPAVVLTVYLFFNRFNKNAILYFVIPRLDFFVLARSAINGVSEMVGMLSASITQVVMNNILMDLDGAMAVAAAGIILAGAGLAQNVFVGYSSGIAPIVSYNYGKGDSGNLKKIFKNSLVIVVSLALATMVLMFVFTDALIGVYDIDPLVYVGGFIFSLPLYDMAHTGLRLISISWALQAVVFFTSTFFTALNDGIKSGFIQFCNGFVFLLLFMPILSGVFGVNGVWLTMPVSDTLTWGVAVFLLWKYGKRYLTVGKPQMTAL